MSEYGARTGVTSLIKFTKLLCRLYLRYGGKINAWVVANIPEPNRATVIQWLGLIAPVCAILTATPDD